MERVYEEGERLTQRPDPPEALFCEDSDEGLYIYCQNVNSLNTSSPQLLQQVADMGFRFMALQDTRATSEAVRDRWGPQARDAGWEHQFWSHSAAGAYQGVVLLVHEDAGVSDARLVGEDAGRAVLVELDLVLDLGVVITLAIMVTYVHADPTDRVPFLKTVLPTLMGKVSSHALPMMCGDVNCVLSWRDVVHMNGSEHVGMRGKGSKELQALLHRHSMRSSYRELLPKGREVSHVATTRLSGALLDVICVFERLLDCVHPGAARIEPNMRGSDHRAVTLVVCRSCMLERLAVQADLSLAPWDP